MVVATILVLTSIYSYSSDIELLQHLSIFLSLPSLLPSSGFYSSIFFIIFVLFFNVNSILSDFSFLLCIWSYTHFQLFLISPDLPSSFIFVCMCVCVNIIIFIVDLLIFLSYTIIYEMEKY